MDNQSSKNFLKDFVMQQEDSGSETDEELASKVALEQHDMYHMLFNDTDRQSESRLGDDKSDFVADAEHSIEVRSDVVDAKNEAGAFSQPGACQLLELVEDMDFFFGPAEWRDVWEWDMGECSRVTAAQNTQQFSDEKLCMASSESDADDARSDYVDDLGECHVRPCLPCRTWSLVDDTEDMANAVAASLVVNEPVFCSRCTDSERAGTSTINDRDLCDDNAVQCMLDDVVNSCVDEGVSWDSADESGLTELDKQNCNTEFSQDFVTDSSAGRVLSRCVPFARGPGDAEDHFCAEDRCTDNGFTAGFAASSMFAQRSSYSSGAHGRSVDSKWNLPRTPPTSENDSCRWKPKKKSWRKNSAGKCTTKICDLLWSHYVIGQTIIFLPCGFFLLSSIFLFFSSPNLSGHRLDVYHASTHGVALVQI